MFLDNEEARSVGRCPRAKLEAGIPRTVSQADTVDPKLRVRFFE